MLLPTDCTNGDGDSQYPNCLPYSPPNEAETLQVRIRKNKKRLGMNWHCSTLIYMLTNSAELFLIATRNHSSAIIQQPRRIVWWFGIGRRGFGCLYCWSEITPAQWNRQIGRIQQKTARQSSLGPWDRKRGHKYFRHPERTERNYLEIKRHGKWLSFDPFLSKEAN